MWRLLASPRGRAALILEDIPRLPDLRSMDRERLQVAVADLVASGVIADDCYGRLIVAPYTVEDR